MYFKFTTVRKFTTFNDSGSVKKRQFARKEQNYSLLGFCEKQLQTKSKLTFVNHRGV